MTFEQFARTRLDSLVRFATVLVGDRALAEDICQEVVIRVRDRWERISSLEQPEAYVRRMIVNEHLSWRRKWARIVPVATVPTSATTPDHAAAIAQHADLLAMIDRLPARQRVALVLRYFEDRSDAEIAELLGCRETTVRGYIHRGLRTLRIEASNTDALDQRRSRPHVTRTTMSKEA